MKKKENDTKTRYIQNTSVTAANRDHFISQAGRDHFVLMLLLKILQFLGTVLCFFSVTFTLKKRSQTNCMNWYQPEGYKPLSGHWISTKFGLWIVNIADMLIALVSVCLYGKQHLEYICINETKNNPLALEKLLLLWTGPSWVFTYKPSSFMWYNTVREVTAWRCALKRNIF